jgi:hypothetical protein
MSTTLGFKDIIDLPQWRPCAIAPTAPAAGSCMAADVRNDSTCDPFIYYLNSTVNLYAYSPAADAWLPKASPGLATFTGAACVFHPSAGPRGTLAAGSSTTKVVISTALPASVAINQLANNGGSLRGFRIRIIGNASGSSSGKAEERTIIANTAGTTPTLTLDSALSFSPASGDAYEILSGRLFMYGGGTTAGCWKYYDCATNSFSASLASPATGSTTVATLTSLSEQQTPNTQAPSTGFFGNLIATGTATGTITGQASSGDAGVQINQYRNFQVRIVTDTGTPAACGQRRRIASHTAGSSPVYTLASNWTTTPSSTATFVIELDDDKIILLHDTSASVFNYNITANTWDSTTWAASAAARSTGTMAALSFGISLGTDLTVDGARHSFLFSFRSGIILDVFDIAGGTTGAWSSSAGYGNTPSSLLNTGASSAYDPVTNGGKYMYFNSAPSATFPSWYRFDLKTRVLEPFAQLRYPNTGTLTAGNKAAMSFFVDGSTKLSFWTLLLQSATQMFSTACQR